MRKATIPARIHLWVRAVVAGAKVVNLMAAKLLTVKLLTVELLESAELAV